MNTRSQKSGIGRWRRAAAGTLLAVVMAWLAACGGGSESASSSDSASAGKGSAATAGGGTDAASGEATGGESPALSATVRITLNLDAPASRRPGTVFWRAGNVAATRAAMTALDAKCDSAGVGSKSCTFEVARDQIVTLVANDMLAELSFGSTPYKGRNVDRRGISSQFAGFTGACTTPERGVCVFTASADQTISVANIDLVWTRVYFLGDVNWRFTLSQQPTLAIGAAQAAQELVVTPNTPGVARCITDSVPVHCYDIVMSALGYIAFEALPPEGPTPLGAIGPLQFVGYDNGCGADPNCAVFSDVDQIVTMKWQYYWCTSPVGGAPFVSFNGGYNFGPYSTCSVVTP